MEGPGRRAPPWARFASVRGRCLPPGLPQDVTDAAHGLDETWLAALLQGFAHRRDSHCQDVRFATELATPDSLHHRVVGHDLVWVLHQRRQEIELLGGQDDLAVAAKDGTCPGIEREVVE